MTKVVFAVVYLAYIATVCLVTIRCQRWWAKLLVTAAGISGLSALPLMCCQLAALFSSLLSLAVSVGVYLVMIIVFIRCLFPRCGRRWF